MKRQRIMTADGYDIYRMTDEDGNRLYNACKEGDNPYFIDSGYRRLKSLISLRGIKLRDVIDDLLVYLNDK